MNLRTTSPVDSAARVSQSVTLLLEHLIDYAGLFPPASLTMPLAVANYRAYLESKHSWILGRFIVPAARLNEFEDAVAQLPVTPECAELGGALSVVLGSDFSADIARIQEFNARKAGQALPFGVRIRSVEVKVSAASEIGQLSSRIPQALDAYFEFPLIGGESECVTAIAACGRHAKIRTGGETADKFPEPERIVEFMQLCLAAGVPFKATAGLHHPVRSVHPFTYQPDSESGMMHGFLNVFLAAAFLRAGLDIPLAVEILKEQSAFQFDSEGATWRGHRLTLRDIALARKGFSISFGSCSFTEPIEDLQVLHLL